MKIPENIKAVIFDVDGLMIDSQAAWIKTHDDFLKNHNIVMDEESLAKLHGIGLKQLIVDLQGRFQLKKSVDDLLLEYRNIFYKYFSTTNTTSMFEGVDEVVKYFYEKGLQLAIATGGHSISEMEQMLSTFNLLKYFEIIVSGDEVERGKPDPDAFLLAAKKLGRESSECLVLEDSVNGLVAGKAAGMMVWGINKDSKFYNDLQKTGADKVFYNIKELL